MALKKLKILVYKRILLMTISLCLILIISLVSYGFGLVEYLEETGPRPDIDDKELESFKPWTTKPGETPGINDPIPSNELKYNKDLYTVLFIGVDTNKERRAKNSGYLSDTLMVLSVDRVTYKSYMISIPRDTLTTVNRLNTRTGEIIGKKYNTKINTAFSYGGGMDKFGCLNACAAVEDLLDIPVRSYIAIDMEGVGPLTDAIGGVYLKIDADFSKWGMPKGSYQNLKGDKALTYVRERKGVGTGGSDIARTKRQLNFVSAYLKKVKKQNPVELLTKHYSLFQKYGRTNIEYPDLYAYANILDKAFNDVHKVSLPGNPDSKGAWVVDRDQLGKIRTEYFFKKY